MEIILVNILAAVNLALYLCSNWQKKRTTIFRLLIICNILSVIEYFIIGTLSGAILCGLCVLQYILFEKWRNLITLTLLCAAFVICGVIFADTWLATALYFVIIIRCIMAYCKNPQRTRESGVLQGTVYPIYDFHYGTALFVIVDLIKLINDTLAAWKHGKHFYRKKAKQLRYQLNLLS